MDLDRKLTSSQVEYINKHGNCNIEVSSNNSVMDAVKNSRYGNSVSAGKTISIITGGLVNNNIGQLLYRVTCEHPDYKICNGMINMDIFRRLTGTISNMDDGRLIPARLSVFISKCSRQLNHDIKPVLFEDGKLSKCGVGAAETYNLIVTTIANTDLYGYIFNGKIPVAFDSLEDFYRDKLITHPLSLDTLRTLRTIEVFTVRELDCVLNCYTNKQSLLKRVRAGTGKNENKATKVVNELYNCGLLPENFDMNDAENRCEALDKSNMRDKSNMSDMRNMSEGYTDEIPDYDIDVVDLFPKGFKKIHLCISDTDEVSVNKQLIDAINDEVSSGKWLLWRVNEPEKYDKMTRIRMVFKRVK